MNNVRSYVNQLTAINRRIRIYTYNGETEFSLSLVRNMSQNFLL